MNFFGIVIAAIVVGVIGLIIGLLLGVAGEKFKVQVDEKELKVRECLPGNNCGGCGYAGCDALAKAIATKEATVDACPVGGSKTAKAISDIMGVNSEEREKMVAFIRCSGTCDKVTMQYNYYGETDCRQVTVVPGQGEKRCEYACMGYGSCVKACPFDAIYLEGGVAVVDKEKCKACGKCLEVCPNNLIEMVPYRSSYLVKCYSKNKGKDTKAACKAGCIGCTLCTKVCDTGAITVSNNLAHIDYSKCTNCGKCAEKCPSKVIYNSK